MVVKDMLVKTLCKISFGISSKDEIKFYRYLKTAYKIWVDTQIFPKHGTFLFNLSCTSVDKHLKDVKEKLTFGIQILHY